MRQVLLILSSFMVFARIAEAQLDFRCRLINSRVLQFENIYVEVTIINHSGERIVLGGSKPTTFLAFDVESSPGVLILPTDQPLLTNEVAVTHAETARFTVNLLPAYQIRATGPYSIIGRLEWRDKVFVTSKMYLDILPGLEIARITGGVPGMAGAIRTYSLRTLNRDRTERAFLRITDDAGRCYGVLDLGRIVRMYKPVMQVDEDGYLQVLHQNGPNNFVRHVISFDGRVKSQETYFGDGTGLRSQASGALQRSALPEALDSESAEGEAINFETLFGDAVHR